MAHKLTYEELLHHVECLEKELAGCKQVEKVLWKSQDQLYSVLDSLDGIVYVADMKTHEILFVNKYTENIFGEIVGKICWQALQVNQQGPCSFCTNDKLLETNGEPSNTLEWEFQNTVNGRWYDIRDRAIKWADGRLVRLEIAIDITDRKKFEEAIRKSEEKFRTVADFTYNWEYWINPTGHYVYISPSCQRVTGYNANDFYENPDLLLSIIHPDDREGVKIHLKKDLKKNSDHHFDFRINTRGGEERWIAHSCQPVFDATGNHLGRRASNRDITKRKDAEKALQESEKYFRLALDATSDGVWDRNLRTGEIYYGENWAKMLGYTTEELKSKRLRWENLLHPDDRADTLAAVKNHLEGHTSRYSAEFRMKNKAGVWLWILARGKVMEWDENNHPLRFVGTHCDISDRKKAEEELQGSSNKIKRFAYSVVHDLKNPAVTIHGLVKHLHKKYSETLDEKGMNFLEQIMRSSKQVADLVDKINIFISTRENLLALEKVSLQETLSIIREEFSTKLTLRAIKWLEPENLPEIIVDRIALLRVVRNFVDNSLKYGGPGLSKIEIGYKESDQFHILFVRDDGVGLQQEESEGILGMFKRKKTTIGIEGTGLGLAIIKEIAEQHQGKVWLEKGVKKGITFYISFSKSLYIKWSNS